MHAYDLRDLEPRDRSPEAPSRSPEAPSVTDSDWRLLLSGPQDEAEQPVSANLSPEPVAGNICEIIFSTF